MQNKVQGFISIYALLLSLSISLVALHTMRSLGLKKDITLALIFQKQSMLYSKSLKEIAISCLKQFDFDTCKTDSINFDDYFKAKYNLTRENDIILLDVMVFSQTLFSTHPLHYSARYVIKGYK